MTATIDTNRDSASGRRAQATPAPAIRLGVSVEITTPSGPETVTLAPIVAESAPLIAGFLERLSPDSRRLRFFGPMPHVTRRLVDELAEIDHFDKVAWLALAGGEMIGEARLGRCAQTHTTADIGVAVRDDWHGRGLGRRLVEVLGLIGAADGIASFTCDVLTENRASLALFRSMDFAFRHESGSLEGYGLTPCWRGTRATADEILCVHRSVAPALAVDQAA